MKYHDKLVALVKATGQEMIDRAEDFVGTGDLISGLYFYINFPQDGGIPTIEVSREHVVKNTFNILAEDIVDKEMEANK